MLRILANGLTLEGGNLVPLLLKAKVWHEEGSEITVFGVEDLEREVRSLGIFGNFRFIRAQGRKKPRSRLSFTFEALRRNMHVFFRLRKFRNRYDVVYSISSVLDLILVPF